MKITVIGGGNIGTLMAAEMAAKGNEVTIYSRRPNEFQTHLIVYGKKLDVLLEADLAKVTSHLKEAVIDADVIWITIPASAFAEIAAELSLYVKKGQKIGVVPGSGGAEFAFRSVIKKGCILFGFQRVHSIARLEQYGRSVHMLGRKEKLQIGTIPADAGEEICRMTEALFDMPAIALPNYLNVTLTPSNPILHTTRLYTMFREYVEGVKYPRNFLFYEEWDDASSKMLIACDKELQMLCHVIPLDLNGVTSLQEHYESKTVSAMTKKISGIAAFKGLTSPMQKKEDGWIPDFTSRYFTADFSYGIKVLIDLADVYKVAVPNMKTVWNWYEQFCDNASYFQLDMSVSEIEETYL